MDVLSPLEKKLLIALEKNKGRISPEKSGMELVKTMNSASWLQSKGLVEVEEKLISEYELTEEGKKFLEEGLPEKSLFKDKEKEKIGEIENRMGKKDAKIAIGWAKRKGWCEIKVENGEKYVVITEKGKKEIERKQEEEKALEKISEGDFEIDEEILKILKRRGAIREKEKVKRIIFLTEKGWEVVKSGIEIKEEISQLTHEIIRSGEWKNKNFRRYDVRAFSPSINIGKPHPLSQLMEKIRKIFSEMGFKEIKGNYVESCFWNMDALFIPQDHPARDMQDTFYCNKPEKVDVDETLIKKISGIHENGGETGSKGWRYSFRMEESKKALLRTHTTVNTIRYLFMNPNPPAKVFSIERVFRRENIDSTHLPEFHQIEGIVYEKDANFCMLKGILKEFYNRMGFEKIRFRPSYFPYTEPSLEIEVMWMDKWIELGGAGIFRPEVTYPFGVKEPVLAWGLGLERIAMIMLGLNDIRKLYFSDIEWLRELPLL
ncbi:MAG TPA: phenylalanine--tRNA ligase subunit alpha [Thermoplasmatales archaeon]|nr:phenylalanine--tRNA ligase subunit alpha [Thermoplasmatales archaeon]